MFCDKWSLELSCITLYSDATPYYLLQSHHIPQPLTFLSVELPTNWNS